MSDETCENDHCEEDANGVYEGIVPPASTLRRQLCDECAPDTEPVKEIEA